MLKKNKLTAERIKTTRKAKGMTQEELALASGYSGKAAIARIESGDNRPSVEKLLAIANVLNVAPDYLAGSTDYEYSSSGRPAVSELISRISNPDCYTLLTDGELERITYLLNNPCLIDIDYNDVLVEVISNKVLSEGGKEAIIRYGNPFMPGNQCEYAVYFANKKTPVVLFKAYINSYEPTMMLKSIKIVDEESFGIEKSVVKELIKISNLFMLKKFYVGDSLIDGTKTSHNDEDYAAGEDFFNGFDYGNMKLEINN